MPNMYMRIRERKYPGKTFSTIQDIIETEWESLPLREDEVIAICTQLEISKESEVCVRYRGKYYIVSFDDEIEDSIEVYEVKLVDIT